MCQCPTDQVEDKGTAPLPPFLRVNLGVATEKPRLSHLGTGVVFIPWHHHT